MAKLVLKLSDDEAKELLHGGVFIEVPVQTFGSKRARFSARVHGASVISKNGAPDRLLLSLKKA